MSRTLVFRAGNDGLLRCWEPRSADSAHPLKNELLSAEMRLIADGRAFVVRSHKAPSTGAGWLISAQAEPTLSGGSERMTLPMRLVSALHQDGCTLEIDVPSDTTIEVGTGAPLEEAENLANPRDPEERRRLTECFGAIQDNLSTAMRALNSASLHASMRGAEQAGEASDPL